MSHISGVLSSFPAVPFLKKDGIMGIKNASLKYTCTGKDLRIQDAVAELQIEP